MALPGIPESFALLNGRPLHAYVLLAAFAALAVWETFRPRRPLSGQTPRRWLHNSLLGILVNSPLGWIPSASAIVVAFAVANSSYGLLNRAILPAWSRYLLAFVLLDLLRYGQHRLYHSISALWRVHRVHHSDPDLDWSSGLLFHPLEVLLSQGSYLAVVALLTPPPIAVLAIELVTVAQNLFEHANVAIPDRLDAFLRWLLITPDMHRIHHSAEFTEQNANFGTVFSWWDRLFGSYVREPAAGQDHVRVGLEELPDRRSLNVMGMLALPFRTLGSNTAALTASLRDAHHQDRTGRAPGNLA